jgi:hypothetical protein
MIYPSPWDRAVQQAWYVQNLQISIPVTVAAALFAITVLWGIVGKQCSVQYSNGR